MSTRAPEASAPGGGPAGTVFDIGYQRYDGPREGRGRVRLAVFKDGVRTALGLGRGAKAKVLPWAFILLLVLIGFIMALVAGAALRLGGPRRGRSAPVALGLLRHRVDLLLRLRRGRRARAAVPRPARRGHQPLPRAAPHRVGLHRRALARVPRRVARRGVAPAARAPGRAAPGQPGPGRVPAGALAGPSQDPRGRGRARRVHDHARHGRRGLHDPARLRVRVPRGPVRRSRPRSPPASPRRWAAPPAGGSRCSTSATSPCT